MKISEHFRSFIAKDRKPNTGKKPLQVKVSISEVSDSLSHISVAEEQTDISNEQMETFKFTINRVYLFASVIGDTTRPFNTYKGHIGRAIWILNLIIHFGLDFYEATHVFHASWATSVGIYLIAFVLASIYTIKLSIPCFIVVLKKLAKDGRYHKTFTNLRKIFMILPYAMPGLTIFGALAQFGCYAYDGALKINFNKGGSNSTKFVPTEVEHFLNVLRMTSLLHIFYAFWLFLLLHLVLLYALQISMREFNTRMTEELKQHPPKIVFTEAVALFSKRTRLLSKCSEKYTPVLAVILVATSISFVVNAYNFLFVRRFAIYVWFALTPLIWTVSPLIFAAWITMTYRKYKYNVIQAWVEIPEMYDEIWERHFEAGQKLPKRKSDLNASKGSDETPRLSLTRKESIKFLKKLKRSIENLRKKDDDLRAADDSVSKDINRRYSDRSVGHLSSEENSLTFTDLTRGSGVTTTENHHRNSSDTHLINAENNAHSHLEIVPTRSEANTTKKGWSMLKPSSGKKRPSIKKRNSWKKYNENSIQHKGSKENAEKSKKTFNYEKYLKYLEVILDTIGYSIAGVLVTWDRVSFFLVILITLVGVFAQAAFLK